MNIMKLIDERHSVRSYKQIGIEPEKVAAIRDEIKAANEESGLNIQFIDNAKGVFNGIMSRFAGWKNEPPAYLAFVGVKNPENEEKCGYYGEKLVLKLQEMGLNTCWVGMFKDGTAKVEVGSGETLIITCAVGYGQTTGNPHKSKEINKVTDVKNMPDWFKDGVESALKAPTAINQQKFFITLEGEDPVIVAKGKGPFINVDLGIVKYHFEAVSGHRCR